MRRNLVALLILWLLVITGSSTALAQDAPGDADSKQQSQEQKGDEVRIDGILTRIETLDITSETAARFALSMQSCDSDGNIYYLNEVDGIGGVHKLSPEGKLLANFQPAAVTADMKIDFADQFTVTPSGEVYQLTFPHEIGRYVFVYGSDGKYKSRIRLQPGVAWAPSGLWVFPSGDLLVTGMAFDREHRDNPHFTLPFTGIFSSSGTLMKKLELSGEGINGGRIEIGGDGNVYVMRTTTPATFYAISAGGEIVRQFTVDPGDPTYKTVGMHISGTRIATLFFQRDSRETIMKITDLEGNDIATYAEKRINGKPPETGPLGLGFVCYTTNPERFQFFWTAEDNHLQLLTAAVK